MILVCVAEKKAEIKLIDCLSINFSVLQSWRDNVEDASETYCKIE